MVVGLATKPRMPKRKREEQIDQYFDNMWLLVSCDPQVANLAKLLVESTAGCVPQLPTNNDTAAGCATNCLMAALR